MLAVTSQTFRKFMRDFLHRYWVVVPILASMASCSDQYSSPRGTMPTQVVSIDLVFKSVGASVPIDSTGAAAYKLSLIHISEPPRPY